MTRQQKKSSNGLPLELTAGMDQEEVVDYEQAWRNSTYVTDKIKKILLDRLDSLSLDDDEDYANPNWPFLRADRNGRIKEIKQILKYLP